MAILAYRMSILAYVSKTSYLQVVVMAWHSGHEIGCSCRLHNPHPALKYIIWAILRSTFLRSQNFVAKKKENWQIYCNFQVVVTVSTWIFISLCNMVGVPVVSTYDGIWRCINESLVENFTENHRKMVEDGNHGICLADNCWTTNFNWSHKWMYLNHFSTISPKYFNRAHIQIPLSTIVCIYYSDSSDITGGNT